MGHTGNMHDYQGFYKAKMCAHQETVCILVMGMASIGLFHNNFSPSG